MSQETTPMDPKIELSGFKVIDNGSMVIARKIIGSHFKRISELTQKMEKLHITLKSVHEREKSEKYEVHANLIDGGKVYSSEVTERNFNVAIDSVLQKLINELD